MYVPSFVGAFSALIIVIHCFCSSFGLEGEDDEEEVDLDAGEAGEEAGEVGSEENEDQMDEEQQQDDEFDYDAMEKIGPSFIAKFILVFVVFWSAALCIRSS